MLAAALRIVWVLYATREPSGFHDPLFYFFYAGRIAEGHGYRLQDGSPTAYYPIGYPAALGAVFALVEHSPIPDNLELAGGFFQMFLGVGTTALAYEAGRRLFNSMVGLVAALWLALFPNLIFHTATFLSETLFSFLVMAALVVIASADLGGGHVRRRRLLLFAVLLGLSALVRPISLLFLPVLLIVLLAAGAGWRRSLEHTVVALAVAAAVVAPWAIRNAVVMRAPIIISANVGDDLCIGHYPGAPGHFALPDYCFAGYEDLERPEFEVRRNNENISKAVKFALKNPAYELRLIPRKAHWLWEHDHDGLWAVESYGDDPFIDPGLRTALMRAADIFFFVTISLGGLGLVTFVLPPRSPPRLFFLMALLALAAVPLAFFGDARFHVPVTPLLAVSAASLVVNIRRVPRLLNALAGAPAPAGAAQPLGPVEIAEGEPSVTEQDTLQDAQPNE